MFDYRVSCFLKIILQIQENHLIESLILNNNKHLLGKDPLTPNNSINDRIKFF